MARGIQTEAADDGDVACLLWPSALVSELAPGRQAQKPKPQTVSSSLLEGPSSRCLFHILMDGFGLDLQVL